MMNIGVSTRDLEHLMMDIGFFAPAFDGLTVKIQLSAKGDHPCNINLLSKKPPPRFTFTAKSSPKNMKREIYQ